MPAQMSKTAIQVILAWYVDGSEMPKNKTNVYKAFEELKKLGYACIDPFTKVWEPTSTLGQVWQQLTGYQPEAKAVAEVVDIAETVEAISLTPTPTTKRTSKNPVVIEVDQTAQEVEQSTNDALKIIRTAAVKTHAYNDYRPDITAIPEPIATMMYWDEAPDWQQSYNKWYAKWHGCRRRAAWAWQAYPYRVGLGCYAGEARLLTKNQQKNHANT